MLKTQTTHFPALGFLYRLTVRFEESAHLWSSLMLVTMTTTVIQKSFSS